MPGAVTDDVVQPFQVDGCTLRGRLVKLGPALARMLAGHAYPPPVARQFGEAAALAATLASALKYDGVFSLQTGSDGPLSMMVIDVRSDGDMRGYARFDPVAVAALTPEEAGSVPHLLGGGRMAFTVDQGPDTERYQGIAPLEGATLADCAHAHLRTSEQVESALVLASDGSRAGCLMVQRMPTESLSDIAAEMADDDWRRGVILASSAQPVELLQAEIEPNDLLYRLYHEDGVRVYKPRPLRFNCHCSRSRVVQTLRAFPRAEVESMAEDGRIGVTCEFCGAAYDMTPEEVFAGDTEA